MLALHVQLRTVELVLMEYAYNALRDTIFKDRHAFVVLKNVKDATMQIIVIHVHLDTCGLCKFLNMLMIVLNAVRIVRLVNINPLYVPNVIQE